MRIDRRTFGLGAAGLAAGCGAQVIGLDAARGILDIGNNYEPFSLDPHKSTAQWESNVNGNMFIGLTTEDAFARPIPGMALSWETSADGRAWRFFLREALWSDGVPCTAYDFEFAFRRILHPETIADYAALLYPIENARAAKLGEAPIETIGVRALDPRTLEIRLAHPAPYLLGLLKHNTAYPIPKHVVERVGDDWIKPAHCVVNGPFALVKWWSNALIRLTKNPRFYDAANVALNDLYFYPTTDEASAARRVRRGELGWSITFPANQIEALRRDMPDYVHTAPHMIVRYMPFNARRAPFDDQRVRRAISLAIDRDFIAQRIYRTGERPATRFVPYGVADYPDRPLQDFAAMPLAGRRETARGLLRAAGYGPERPLRFAFTHASGGDPQRVAVVVQAQCREIADWVQVELRPLEGQVLYATLRAHDFDMASGTWTADFNDARNFLYLFETRTGAQNYSGHANPAYDALMERSDQERDAVRRAAMLHEAEVMMLARDPVVPVAFGVSRNLAHPRLAGFEDNIEDIHRARWFRILAET